ncbi:hypothetical protein BDV96DRAFT_486077, partial [Lophiotrema nucula]
LLITAKACFREAARLAPKDPVPLSNLSAVEFELGNYIGCELFSQKALGLLAASDGEQNENLHEKLLLRSARAKLYSNKLEDAEKFRELVLDRIPRYRPALQDAPEYFTVGHDWADSLLSSDLVEKAPKDVSFLLCGIGDARHLLATIIVIGLLREARAPPATFHFTLVDVKPAVFARDLVIFQLLFDSMTEKKAKLRDTIVTLCYVYAAQVMPQWAYDRLQKCLATALDSLDMERSHLRKLFYIPQTFRERISHHLEAWQHLGDGAPDFSPPGCEENGPDAQMFLELGVMLPHVDLLEKREPELFKLFMAWGKTRSVVARTKIHKYVDSYWKPNVTLVDLDYERKREGPHRPLIDFRPDEVARSLWTQVPHAMAGDCPPGILNYLAVFFDLVASNLEHINSKAVIEIVIAEMGDTFDRLRYGLLRHRQEVHGGFDPSTFPAKFDRIHMSNIPDYVGGPLITFTQGLSLLRHDGSSALTSNVLRNTPVWMTHDDFLAEYLLLPTRQQVKNHFRTQLSAKMGAYEAEIAGTTINGAGAVMAATYDWVRASTSTLSWEKLMSRQKLENWLYSHFLKLSLPHTRPTQGNLLIIAPLNLTAFFHLVINAFEAGYPAHWLSDIMSKLNDGEITTSSRAPTATQMTVTEVQKSHPLRKMSVKPFRAEFQTLLAIWRPLLPFGLHLSSETLPQLGRICEFMIKFQPNYNQEIERPHFVLVLRKSMPTDRKNLRHTLLDDGTGDTTAAAIKLRTDPGIHVISVFKFTTDTQTVSFWMDEMIIDHMQKEGGWAAFVWRSDNWLPALGPVLVHDRDSVTKGLSWVSRL